MPLCLLVQCFSLFFFRLIGCLLTLVVASQEQLADDPMRLRLWFGAAYSEAMLASTSRSSASQLSAIRVWLQFAKSVLKLPEHLLLPPPLMGLIVWTTTFK